MYKLFTMSLLNLSLNCKLSFFDDCLKNTVDLGYKKDITENDLINADVLDWSGIRKPWFKNGLYREYWKKYNLLYEDFTEIDINKNTVEKFN